MSRHAASGTHVYIIDAGDLCKIGTTSRVAKRVTQVVSSYSGVVDGRRMKLAAAWEVFPHAALVERNVRASLRDLSFSLDWFYCDVAEMREAAEIAMASAGIDPTKAVRNFGALPADRTPCTHPIYLAAIEREKQRKAAKRRL